MVREGFCPGGSLSGGGSVQGEVSVQGGGGSSFAGGNERNLRTKFKQIDTNRREITSSFLCCKPNRCFEICHRNLDRNPSFRFFLVTRSVTFGKCLEVTCFCLSCLRVCEVFKCRFNYGYK